MKRAVGHFYAVIKGVLIIGFLVQILLGLLWMCCNFGQVQDFGGRSSLEAGNLSDKTAAPDRTALNGIDSALEDFALYRGLFRLLGSQPSLMYLLQLAAAFLAGYFFLKGFLGRWYLVWCSLALLTFPFAMQCHLAVLPHSLMGSLFLLIPACLGRALRGDRSLRFLGIAALCGVLALLLSGIFDKGHGGEPGRSFAAAAAGRAAWPTLWADYERWPEELQEIVEDVAWEAAFYPEGMRTLEAVIEERAGRERAEEYYGLLAKTAWEYHAPMIIRQIGWDALGYGVTPLIFRLQMEGEGYDSYSGRNYEAMRGNTPALTGIYVEYGCWWFGCSLALTVILAAVRCVMGGRIKWKSAAFAGICILMSGVLIGILTMRGAGLMDYKYTIGVNELWLIWAFLTTGGADAGRREG